MIRIGLLSDTHGFFDSRITDHFEGCDEIWHAGDIGDYEVIVRLSRIGQVVAVYGNIDGTNIRSRYPGHQRHTREGLDIWMTHIGGIPRQLCTSCKAWYLRKSSWIIYFRSLPYIKGDSGQKKWTASHESRCSWAKRASSCKNIDPF